jgi:hypothetical protein
VNRKLLAGIVGVVAVVGLTAADCTPPSSPNDVYVTDPSDGGYPDVETTGHDTPLNELTVLDLGCAGLWVDNDGYWYNPAFPNTPLVQGKTLDGYHVTAAGVRVVPGTTGVVIRDSLIDTSYAEETCENIFWVVRDEGSGTLVEDTELDGEGVVHFGLGLNDGGTARRLNIHDVEDGMGVGGDTSIQDNYIHDLSATNTTDPHYDGIETTSSDVVLHHNTILVPEQTGAINIGNNNGALSNILIFQNLLAGGTYTIYVDDQFGTGQITNVDIAGNLFGGLGSEKDPEEDTPFGHWFIRGTNNTPQNQPDSASFACDNRNDLTDALLPTFGDQSGC